MRDLALRPGHHQGRFGKLHVENLFPTPKDVAVVEHRELSCIDKPLYVGRGRSGNLFQPTMLCLTRVAEIVVGSESDEQVIGCPFIP